MRENFERSLQKTPGTLRREIPEVKQNYSFVPVDPIQRGKGMYEVVCVETEVVSVPDGCKRKVPPLVFDQRGRYNRSGTNVPVARSWREGTSTHGLQLFRRG